MITGTVRKGGVPRDCQGGFRRQTRVSILCRQHCRTFLQSRFQELEPASEKVEIAPATVHCKFLRIDQQLIENRSKPFMIGDRCRFSVRFLQTGDVDLATTGSRLGICGCRSFLHPLRPTGLDNLSHLFLAWGVRNGIAKGHGFVINGCTIDSGCTLDTSYTKKHKCENTRWISVSNFSFEALGSTASRFPKRSEPSRVAHREVVCPRC